MRTRDKTECACDRCKAMCRTNPCAPTPTDVMRLIVAGYKNRLAVGVVKDAKNDILWPLVMPKFDVAKPGCTFLNEDGLCDLHAANLKPTEGKFAIHDKEDEGLQVTVAYSWVTEEGIKVIELFENHQPALRVLKIYKASRDGQLIDKVK